MTIQMFKCALVVLSCFVVAGVAQTLFLKSEVSALFAAPLDRGRTLRGRRLLGANKTWRGVVVLIPAVTLCFAFAGALAVRGVLGPGLWPLTQLQWAGLGLAAGVAYALGELPNSFIKRQLDVAPGEQPAHWLGRKVAFFFDQLDSIMAALLMIALWVPTDWRFHLASLGLGALLHWLFNVVLWLIGVKREAR